MTLSRPVGHLLLQKMYHSEVTLYVSITYNIILFFSKIPLSLKKYVLLAETYRV